ncbi:hypothetical protein CW362_05480 [Streptomyces populi]|uniref:Uncharacterized protein n=2 Tax=Streptomyces populi TaxID=2058924 RepID=A0A2I0SVY5_9ACTN|nr:hypothetical protein CW362_05480 [Streptomyces populi]
MRSPDHKTDRIGPVIASVVSVGSLYAAHLVAPELSLGLLLVPGILLGTAVAMVLRKPKGRGR